MKSLSKIIITLITGLVVFTCLVFFFVSPMISEVNTINANVKEKKIELDILDQQISAFKSAQTDLTKAIRKEDLLKAIVTREDLVIPVKDLEAAAAKAQTLEVLSIKENSSKDQPSNVIGKKAGLVEVPYELKTTSDYTGFINFFSYLEHLPHFTEISQITLTSEIGSDQNGSYSHTGKVFSNLKGVFFSKTPTP